MPIEFRCQQCNRLLRTGDGTAGKQAKCPDCGAVVVVPDGSTEASEPGDSPFGAPLPSQSPSGSPFGSGAAGYQPADETGNPYQSPSALGTAPATAYAQSAGEITPTRIDLEDIFSRTWRIYKEQWGACLAAFVVVFAINMVLRGPIIFMQMAFDGNDGALVLLNLANIVVILVVVWINLGQMLYFLKIARGQPAELSDLFTGGPYYLRVLGAGILFGLIVVCGYVLLIIPGIILGLMLSQFAYVILDRNVGVMDSLSISKDLMVGNKLTLFLISLVGSVISFVIILLTCGVGILAVAPFMTLLAPVIYLGVSGQPTADQIAYGPPAE